MARSHPKIPKWCSKNEATDPKSSYDVLSSWAGWGNVSIRDHAQCPQRGISAHFIPPPKVRFGIGTMAVKDGMIQINDNIFTIKYSAKR